MFICVSPYFIPIFIFIFIFMEDKICTKPLL